FSRELEFNVASKSTFSSLCKMITEAELSFSLEVVNIVSESVAFSFAEKLLSCANVIEGEPKYRITAAIITKIHCKIFTSFHITIFIIQYLYFNTKCNKFTILKQFKSLCL